MADEISALRKHIAIYNSELDKLRVLARNPAFLSEQWREDWMRISAILFVYIHKSIINHVRNLQSSISSYKYLDDAVNGCIMRIEAAPWKFPTTYSEVTKFRPTGDNLIVLPHGVDIIDRKTKKFLIGDVFNGALVEMTKAMFYIDPVLPQVEQSVHEITNEIKCLSRTVYSFRKDIHKGSLPRPAVVQSIFIIMQDFYQIRKAILKLVEEVYCNYTSKYGLLEYPLLEMKDTIPECKTLNDMLLDCQIGYKQPNNNDIEDAKGRLLFEDRIKPSLLEVYKMLSFIRNFCKIRS